MTRCRWMRGTTLLPLVPERLRGAIDPAAEYAAPWREGERTQVMVPTLSGGCVLVALGKAAWAALPVRDYVVD
jgi:hypothetical protein